jgi:putative SOS response-associated peptidase YedK
MCGRFTLTSSGSRLRDRFGLSAAADDLAPRYNIAPTQPVLVIPNRSQRLLRPARWGLMPHWSKDRSAGNRLINVRAETLAARPQFRTLLERQRCLIPADGFYEWKRAGTRQRAPYYIHARDGQPLALAGLWDVWHPPQGEPLASCTIITTAPNELVAELHERMPVILPPEAYEAWLNPRSTHADALLSWLAPCPADWLSVHAVSELVNSPANEDPACIAPV